MGTPPLSRELARQAVDAMSSALSVGKGNRYASRLIGISSGTMTTRLEAAARLYGMLPQPIDDMWIKTGKSGD